MSVKKTIGLMALAVAVLAGTGDNAAASYSYSTSLSIVGGTTSATGSTITVGGTTVTLFNISGGPFAVPSTNTINIGDIAVTTTTLSPAVDTFTVTYADTFVLTNSPPPGTLATGAFTLSGTLTFNGINTGSGIVTNAYTLPTSASGPFAGLFFSGATLNFAAPTVNGARGSFGGIISANVIPAPASLVILGLGLGGVGLIRHRSRHGQRT